MLVSGKTWLDGLLNAWPMQWLGTISYGLYLWHYPVMLLVREHMGGMQYIKTDFISFLIVGFLVSVTLAFLSWHWLEAPILKRVSNRRR
jgi:peptidoglycan/LPS O-acetylase OafA/YrhL